jgi:thiol:disulfide interchange protein DsbA
MSGFRGRHSGTATMMRMLGWLAVIAACSVLVSIPVRADLVEGQDYVRLNPPQTTNSPGKIEVLEFFSYACHYCYDLHPKVTRWAAKLPSNAVFVRVPVALGHREWGPLVRTYYALESTGDLARLDTPLFDAINKEKQRLFDERSITAWVVAHGVDAEKFTAAFNSFSVSTKSSRAEQMGRTYRIDGTPRLSIDGRYVAFGRTHDEMLTIARELIDKAAKEGRLTKQTE